MDSPRRKYGRMMRGSKQLSFPNDKTLKRNLENRAKVRASEFVGNLCGESSALKGLVTLYDSKIRMERKAASDEQLKFPESVQELLMPSPESDADEHKP